MPLVVAVVLCCVTAVRQVTSKDAEGKLIFGLVTATALVLGALTDYAASIVLRKIVAYRQTSNVLRRHVVAIIAQLAVGLVVITAPLLGGAILAGGHGALFACLGWSVMVSAATNVFTLAFSVLFVCAGLTLLVHRALWPLAQRPVYLLARLRVFASMSRKAALFSVGAAAIAVAVAQGGDMLRALLALVKAG